jgi:hypothetical protein
MDTILRAPRSELADASRLPPILLLHPPIHEHTAGPALPGLDGLDAVGGPVRPAAQARA